jgi:hypothetical protein
MDERLTGDPVERAWLRIPQSEGRALASLEAHAVILRREYSGDGISVELEVNAPESLLRRLAEFRVAEPAKNASAGKKPRARSVVRRPAKKKS